MASRAFVAIAAGRAAISIKTAYVVCLATAIAAATASRRILHVFLAQSLVIDAVVVSVGYDRF